MLDSNANLKQVVDGFDNLKNTIDENRINLRNKLYEKGINVYSEEKLSSLINKVDGVGCIDVISANELPLTVKNNQIVLITSECNNIILSKTEPTMEQNDIWIKVVEVDGKEFLISDSNKKHGLRVLNSFKKNNDILEDVTSYIGIEDEWVELIHGFFVFRNGVFENQGTTGTLTTNFTSSYEIIDNSLSIQLKATSSTAKTLIGYITTSQAMDFTPYKKLKCKISTLSLGSGISPVSFSFGVCNNSGVMTAYTDTSKTGEIEVDITDVNISRRIGFRASMTNSHSINVNFKVDYIVLS